MAENKEEVNALKQQLAAAAAANAAMAAAAANNNGEPPGPEYALRAGRRYFNNRKTSIYGGSNEIQRNIVAKAILEL